VPKNEKKNPRPCRVWLTRVFDVGEEGVVGSADGLEGDPLVGVPSINLGEIRQSSTKSRRSCVIEISALLQKESRLSLVVLKGNKNFF